MLKVFSISLPPRETFGDFFFLLRRLSLIAQISLALFFSLWVVCAPPSFASTLPRVSIAASLLHRCLASSSFASTLSEDCIGAIDGTHIPAMIVGNDSSNYRNRHGFTSQNVLTACNFDLEFIYVLSGWEGSAHDSRILTDALSRRNGLKLPQGKYFLVDCGFSNRRQFLAPFRGVRYHLSDFTGQGRHPENANELFNLRHASLRNVVERLFGIFKSRFTIFKTTPPFPFKIQAKLVLACAGLHNYLRKECRSDEFPIELDTEDALSSYSEEDDDFEILSETQEQQRENANQ
ncbi:hypothetical protein Scep_003419 [Stephania cephalantha]|uniref:DDE Tnp4 domain-containing protein n=1 Tax=Stephania cephalantha TaxID=152367 RepID=A0AAP0KRE2_9MAGN